ncbi:hypothetical protein C5167_036572 [Papaver somniferum]|uniref:MADS-box domain-containing protein n=1 Tax=Papaver somniferum TaxID=3469 RepID=A0A4Y7I879_PAPSO|nr:hypothetical protein C5167_036572 [Papaver somniferum]
MICNRMGRAKLDMKLIANLKRRKETYQKRKIGLKKKLHEFTVLCNVPACMILYGPSQGDRPVKVETWPPELDEVNNIIERYRQVPEENKQKRRQDLYDFFQERNMFSNNIQQQLDGSLYRPFFGGQGVSTDHHSQYKKIKTNDYQPCDNNSFMLNSAYMYANIPYDPPMLSRGNTDFGYPVSSTFNVMPTSTLMPIPWSGSMHSAGYPSHYYQPPMHHGSSSSQGPQRLFTMNSFPMSSGSTLRQMSYPPEESFGIQDQPNRYRQQ